MGEEDNNTKELRGIPLFIQVLGLVPERDGLLVFTDQFQEAYAAVDFDGSQVMKISSSEFEDWLFNYVYEITGIGMSDSQMKSVLKILNNRAKNYSCSLLVRTAREQDRVYYDLGSGKFVEVTEQGWEVIEPGSKILFKKFKHQKQQVSPEPGGTLDDFIRLVNVTDKKSEILLKIYLVAAFIPNFPHPVLVIQGPQGSSKTTLCRFLKDLIDPSSLESDSLFGDNDIPAFIQKASHHWLFVLDNLSFLSDKISDVISRICTGGGLSKRKLYSDDDDFIYNFKHLIALNGITQVVYKPDLLDRSLMIQLDRIGEQERLTEDELWAKFESVKPGILGAIFDAVSEALKEYPNIQVEKLPRMADFVKMGCAIAKAIGYTQEEFLQAFEQNTISQTDAAVEGNPIAAVIADFMEDREHYLGSPGELYQLLSQKAFDLGLQNSYGWPKAANTFTKQFPVIQPVLQTLGLQIRAWKSNKRYVEITKVNSLDGLPDDKIASSHAIQSELSLGMDDADGLDDINIPF